jgi:hypothetical protein
MATYRKNGIKWNRANWANVDADCVKGLNAYIASREAVLNTITTSVCTYSTGPFAGQPVELCDGGAGMLPFNFKGWVGCYVAGVWEGTTGQPLATVEDAGMMTKNKDAGSLGKGYEALGDLFGAMAEDPKDHEQETTIRKSIYVAGGLVDDFGDQIKDPAAIGIYSAEPAYYSSGPLKINTWGENPASRGAPYAADDFGSLFALSPVLVRPVQEIHFNQRCVKAVYTIGRTTYKINATAQAVDALRARILAKKRFFADKNLQTVRPAQTAEEVTRDVAQMVAIDASIAAKARQDVAQVLASARAAAVIEQAQIATPSENTEREPWQMTRAEYTGQQPAAYRDAVGNSHRRDVSRALARGDHVTPDVLAAYPELSEARELATVDCGSDDAATVCELGSVPGQTGSHGRVLVGVSATQQSPAEQSVTGASFGQFKSKTVLDAAPVDGAPAPVARAFVPANGQHIKSKSGAWEAWSYVHKSGKHCFVMYRGRSAKPWKHFNFKDRARMIKSLAYYAADAQSIADSLAKRALDARAQADKPHGLQVGDVLRSSWGYDQTNVDHYQIVKLIGKRTAEVRKLNEHIDYTGDMQGRSAPIPDDFCGDVLRRQIDRWGNVNILSAAYGRASKIEPLAVVAGVRCYRASAWSSYA